MPDKNTHSAVNSEWWGGSGRVDEALFMFCLLPFCLMFLQVCILLLKSKKKKNASINKTYASKGKGKESHCFPAWKEERRSFQDWGRARRQDWLRKGRVRGSVMLWCLGEAEGGPTHVMVYTSPQWRRDSGAREWGEIEILTSAECAEGERSRSPARRAWNKASTK